MKICLFGLKGFGNLILAELNNNPIINDVVVFTRREKGKFPYYTCEQLTDLCNRQGVQVYLDKEIDSDEVYNELKRLKPDLILVATFNQKIPQRIVDIPEMGAINIHPSLLPKYRGPTPTHWVLINGEEKSGVTYHLVSAEFDLGDILFQEEIQIAGLVDGELRNKLARLAGKMLPSFLKMHVNGEIQAQAQKIEEGSYYPRITSEEGIVLLRSGRHSRENIIRGLTPYPGVEILD
jgi:methionyl-tRNA formyltransferase